MNHRLRLSLIAATLVGSFCAIIAMQLLEIELDATVTGGVYTLFLGAAVALADAWKVRERVIDDPTVLRERREAKEKKDA